MRSIIVDKKSSNMKIEKYLQAMYPALSYGTLQKALRRKDIKANGKRIGKDYTLAPGDRLEIYIADDLLTGTGNSSASALNKAFSIIFEDDNLIIVNKEQGIPVHPDKGQSGGTLIDLVREYLKDKTQGTGNEGNAGSLDSAGGAENIRNTGQFQPALCHRLDRNTGGLVIIAKNQACLDILLKKLEAREVKKYYLCVVKGKMEKPRALLKAWLWKDAGKSLVYVNERRTAGSVEIITEYKVVSYEPTRDISLLEVELITGRTHQIRAHLAFIGHPVIGDGKYGTNTVNRSFSLRQQALWAYKIRFSFKKEAPTMLDYLNNLELTAYPDALVKAFGFSAAKGDELRLPGKKT